MNPANSLRELQRMMEPPANDADLSRVSAELHVLLRSDPILATPPFVQPRDELVALLASDTPKNLKNVTPLISAYSRELLAIVEDQYISAIFQALEGCLTSNVDALPDSDRAAHIPILTGNLLSTLLDRGGSMESLYQLYRQVLCPRRSLKRYDFDSQFDNLRELITQDAKQFTVVFTIDNVSNTRDFPNKIGAVEFSTTAPVNNESKPQVRKYLTPNPKRLFATVSVQTVDLRNAGEKAYEKINTILDLVRFEYERAQLKIPDEFAISDHLQNKYRIYPIPKVIPNPDTSIDNDGLHRFVKSVNELVGNPDLQEDGRNRVQSAFRLYRVGADTNIFENKLISWWTAIEYLVKGTTSSGGIGDAVERTLTPVLCLRYIEKLIISFRNALVDQKAAIKEPLADHIIQLKEMDSLSLYELFKDESYRGQLMEASIDPFMKKKFEDFLHSVSSPKHIDKMLEAHEQRLRWHIHRVYRARCDIIHSAERVVNAALLCANLEFYLKTTLTVLLRSLRAIPRISGPKEFFDRQSHEYERLRKSLSKGEEDRLLMSLKS
ncbi:MAG: hypothetical protein EOM12_14705 [Verrucomicrobiae bacterium]|nr:hypothetical protein [Verrucomicrobiae bacterium]